MKYEKITGKEYDILCKYNISKEMKHVVIACHGFMGAKDIPMFDALATGLEHKE